MKKPNVSIIFPVHNEEEGITEFIKYVFKQLKQVDFTYEVFFIENGSRDNSFNILKELQKEFEFKLLKSRKGWGNAVKEGFKNAQGEYICYMVSDWQVDPKYISFLMEKITKSNFDMVKVSRMTRENKTRLVNSRLYNLLAIILFGTKTFDINATPKIIKAKIIKNKQFISENIAFDLELLLFLKKNKYKWKDFSVPSSKRKTGVSTTNIKSIIEMLRYMMIFRFSSPVRKEL